MQELPQVTLDNTLAELYNRDGPVHSHGQLALLLCAANSEVAPTSKLARNKKFLYQDSTFSNTPEKIDPKQQEEIEKSVAVKYLSLVPQHDAFAAGNMPVILFDSDSSGKAIDHSKEEAERTMSSLTAAQRPKLLFFSDPTQIAMEENGISCLATKMEFDEVEGLPLALDLDTHYFLNSKAALCTSGLPRYVTLEGNAYLDLEGIDRRWERSLLTGGARQSQMHTTRNRGSQRRARKVL